MSELLFGIFSSVELLDGRITATNIDGDEEEVIQVSHSISPHNCVLVSQGHAFILGLKEFRLVFHDPIRVFGCDVSCTQDNG